MMRASFSVLDEAGGWVSEEALTADLPRAALLFADPPRMEGGLVIEDPDSGVRVDVGDTMDALIAAFCQGGLDRLERDNRAEIKFLDRRETLTVTCEGELVRFDSPESGQQAFPHHAYVAAMRDCGERYRKLVDAVGALGPTGFEPREEA